MKIPVNENAPVLSESKIEINAPISKVWEVLTTIENWPKWQTDVTEARLDGPVGAGTEFIWKAGGLTFHSRIHTSDSFKKFGWTGKTFGASAIHNWKFTETGEAVLVQVEESLEGILPSLFKKYFQKNLDTGVRKNLEELKGASEKTTDKS